ncbi:MAG: peptidoglycan DD-metalloendopeptidase family protein [Oscillibacter sp.]
MNDELKKVNTESKRPQKGGKRLAAGAPPLLHEKIEPPKPGRREAKDTERPTPAALAGQLTERFAPRRRAADSPAPRREKPAGEAAKATARREKPAREAAKTAAPASVSTPPSEKKSGSVAVAERPVLEKTATPFTDEKKPTARKAQTAGDYAAKARAAAGDYAAKAQVLWAKLQRIPRRWKRIVHEKRARHFPESERILIQFLLFAWGMFPMLGSRLREITWGRRKRAIHHFARVRAWLEGQKTHPAAFLGLSAALAVVALFFSIYTFGTTVTYDGETVAAVNSKSAAVSALSDLEQVTASTLGSAYTIDEKLLQYDSGLLRRQDVVAADVLEEDLSQEIGLVTSAYCLYVQGELIGATPYEGALEELLLQLKNGITDENTISCDFSENVEIKQEYVPTEKIMNLGYLAEMLYSTKTAEITYTVESGDTWSEIANSHGLTSAELLAINPGYNINRLSIGEVLTMSASVPYLTMTVVQRERYVADLPFDIEYTDSASLFQGDYKVTSAGDYGAADMLANVTYVNGEEIDRTILSSVTLQEPVTEQRLRGTKERPSWMATGSFRWPCTGRITSRFGYRNLSYSYASKNHKGIDIAGRHGTPIYAADGGTVTYSGWMSGYGYLVQIDHGNGYVSYYGHNSSLIVSRGQHVYKGQQIAKMGSTGNSTGNHCHFEVRYHGVPKNPMNYL